MNSHRFSFPPPPPAPPKKAPQSYPGIAQPFVDPNGYRGRENSRDFGDRTCGRDYNRGGRRVGQYGSLHPNIGYGNISPGTDNRNSSSPAVAFSARTNAHNKSGHLLPSYPPIQLPQFPSTLNQSHGRQSPVFPAHARGPQAAHPTSRNGSYQFHNEQRQSSSHGYNPSLPAIQASLPAPVLMGPPIRMGFDALRRSSQHQQHFQPTVSGANMHQHGLLDGNESPYQHSSALGLTSGRHESSNTFPGHRGRGQTRGRSGIYSRSRNQNHRMHVAPAVPSFGSPLTLPSKPPALHENIRKPRKKKRRQNQLGLTPRAEQHESSEEDDDTDEEARLAAVAASGRQGHQL